MKVAIIGAGASGLTAIKCCLDEGLEPVCYERTEDLGGLWNYNDQLRPGQASVMKSTVINTSKEVMCYSDFPIPAEYPIFMHNRYVLQYFRLYAKEFDLVKHIKFRHEIVSVKKHKDFADTGKWKICVHDGVTRETEELVYDAVLICTGHLADVHRPTFKGLDRFKGKVLHSHDYKRPVGYENKKIVIIGIGNSGGDAAVELSHVASQVYLSTRRGTWIMNRIVDHGLPLDMANINRFLTSMLATFPNLGNSILERKLNQKFDHELYSLKPNHRVFAQHPMVNDDLPNRIISGAVVIKSDVAEFTETGVKFDDGTFVEDVDVVFLATGYVFGFPFLDKAVIDVKNNEVELFKYAFPPDLEKPTLAVIGFIQPIGAIMPISELQCRLATRLFKGDVTLPSKPAMWQDIRVKKAVMSHIYVKSQRHTIQVYFAPFLDELARLNGSMPNFKCMYQLEVAVLPAVERLLKSLLSMLWNVENVFLRSSTCISLHIRAHYPIPVPTARPWGLEGSQKSHHDTVGENPCSTENETPEFGGEEVAARLSCILYMHCDDVCTVLKSIPVHLVVLSSWWFYLGAKTIPMALSSAV